MSFTTLKGPLSPVLNGNTWGCNALGSAICAGHVQNEKVPLAQRLFKLGEPDFFPLDLAYHSLQDSIRMARERAKKHA